LRQCEVNRGLFGDEYRFVTMRKLFLLTAIALFGCSMSPLSGPKSVKETSAVRALLSDRIEFIENYVNFRRSYNKLEYVVLYQNNGSGMVPGPSDWDIKILAVVPANEVAEWIPAKATRSQIQPPPWLNTMPGNIPVTNITEWYQTGRSVIGVDRATSTIAYRNTTMHE
jgi:hypothetical protein